MDRSVTQGSLKCSVWCSTQETVEYLFTMIMSCIKTCVFFVDVLHLFYLFSSEHGISSTYSYKYVMLTENVVITLDYYGG